MTGVLQLHPPIPVETPLGEGLALIILDYSTATNTVWICALKKTREIKHFSSEQLKIAVNRTWDYL